MKARKYSVLSTVLMLAALSGGCYSSKYGTCDLARTQNRKRISQLSQGMEKQQVLDIMGEQTITCTMIKKSLFSPEVVKTFDDPVKSDTLQIENRSLEVIYYYTDERGDRELTDEELTPLVFENDVLIGWGRLFLKMCTLKPG